MVTPCWLQPNFTTPLPKSSLPLGVIVPSQFQNLRVLVVDDNSSAREILSESLGSLARQVDAVSSGHEALAAIKQRDRDTPYDVIFMDWRMPGMDGLQATRLISCR